MSEVSGPVDPRPASTQDAIRDMHWCRDCGAVQRGERGCLACEGRYQREPLGFKDLYNAYSDPLRRFVRRLTADRGLPESLADTEGIVHDTFMILAYGYSAGPIRNPSAWLFTVARNQVSKAAAAQSRIAPGDPADHWHTRAAMWLSVITKVPDAEDVRAAREVMHAIAGLPDHQRIATYLRQVEGWSLAEIGEYLNCAPATAGVHISRGTGKVRSSLYGDHDEAGGVRAFRLSSGREYPVLRLRHYVSTILRRGALPFLVALAATGVLLIARALGVPWWLAVVIAAAAGGTLAIAVVFIRTRRLRRRLGRLLRTGRVG